MSESLGGARVTLACMLGVMLIGALGAAFPVPPILSGPILLAFFAAIFIQVLQRLHFEPLLIGLLIAGIAVYMGYLSYTGATERSYDAKDQLAYIYFIAQHGKLPGWAECSSCHHPPLYYVLAALWLRLTAVTQLASPELCLQLFSLLISAGFLVFAVLTIKRFLRHGAAVGLATALVVFWPYSIINSIRVHNDTLVCALMAGAMYFTIQWWQEGREKVLHWAAVFVGLGLLTKSNAYVVAGCLALLLGWRLWATRSPRLLRSAAGVALVVGACASVGIVRKSNPAQWSWCERVFGLACGAIRAGTRQVLPNKPLNYLYFDIRGFLLEPFIDGNRRETGTEYFWNDLLKSSLFGTHNGFPDPQFGYALNWSLATVINFLLLGMVVLVLIAGAIVTTTQVRRYGILLFIGGAFILFLAAFRSAVPVAHHVDFRFVFPLVIPGSVILAQTIDHFRRERWLLHIAGYVLTIPFILLSILFFVPK